MGSKARTKNKMMKQIIHMKKQISVKLMLKFVQQCGVFDSKYFGEDSNNIYNNHSNSIWILLFSNISFVCGLYPLSVIGNGLSRN